MVILFTYTKSFFSHTPSPFEHTQHSDWVTGWSTRIWGLTGSWRILGLTQTYPLGLPRYFYSEVKLIERGTDHSRPYVRNAWSYAFMPPYAFVECWLIRHRDTLLFFPTLLSNTLFLFTCFCWGLIRLQCSVFWHSVALYTTFRPNMLPPSSGLISYLLLFRTRLYHVVPCFCLTTVLAHRVHYHSRSSA
jgi:hypothetical protein